MTIVFATTPPCATKPEIFQDEHLNNQPPRQDMTAAAWNQLVATKAAAHRACAACPIMVDCLYRAVVEVDVSGYAACTTETERRQMRRKLGVEVQQVQTAAYGDARVVGGPVSHEAVMTVRHAYPKDTCLQLAERLGCSTSTVKRHLRREREAKAAPVVEPAQVRSAMPTIDAVLDTFDELATAKIA